MTPIQRLILAMLCYVLAMIIGGVSSILLFFTGFLISLKAQKEIVNENRKE